MFFFLIISSPFTPTHTLPHQGGGDFWWNVSVYYLSHKCESMEIKYTSISFYVFHVSLLLFP